MPVGLHDPLRMDGLLFESTKPRSSHSCCKASTPGSVSREHLLHKAPCSGKKGKAPEGSAAFYHTALNYKQGWQQISFN